TVLFGAKGIEYRLGIALKVQRIHRAAIVGAAVVCRAVKYALLVDQTREGMFAVSAIRLAAKGIDHGLSAGVRVQREHCPAPVGPAILGRTVKRSVHIDQT